MWYNMYIMEEDNYNQNSEQEDSKPNDPICPRCGLRSYDDSCQVCGTPIVDTKDDEEEEYDWREHKR